MIIDYSQLSTFISCPRKFYNRYILKLRRSQYDEREIDKDFGGAIHLALETYYKTGAIKKGVTIFRESYTGLEAEKVKTPQNGEFLLTSYHNYWSQPTNALSDTNLSTIGVEVQDTYKIGAVEYLVKIDRIVKSPAGIFVMDHKTTSSIASKYFWQFDPNMQISGYCEYVRQKYGQCSGAIINVMAVGYRARKYKGEPAGFHCEFARDIINRNPDQLEDFRDQVWTWVTKLEVAGLNNSFPKNENACHNYRGCGFRELCISCDDENVRETLYETYDPTEYLKGNDDTNKV